MNTNEKALARQAKIRDLLQKHDVITISEFCRLFGVSVATIRNDLTFLEKQGSLRRVRGGAISCEGTPRNTTYASRIHLNEEAKRAIARKAADMIEPGMTVILDAGTTCQYLAQEILHREIPCTICTSSLSAMMILSKASFIDLVSTGGLLDHDHNRFMGSFSQSPDADLFFLSPDGIKDGVATGTEEKEARRKQEFVNQARQTVVLADSSKEGREADWIICENCPVLTEN